MGCLLTKKLLIITIFLLVGTLMVTVRSDIVAVNQEETSLEDVRNNPENYLGERNATFTIVNVTLRPDPYKRLRETYYLVYVRDSYDYEVPFVISKDDYQKYSFYTGKLVLFKLTGRLGPGLVHPPDRLITNILVSKAADPYQREYYTVFITLIGSTEPTPISIRGLLGYLPIAGVGAAVSAAIIYMMLKSSRSKSRKASITFKIDG